jgi:ABC-type Zn2+ transport system substrate-binding protein/surface adhesin
MSSPVPAEKVTKPEEEIEDVEEEMDETEEEMMDETEEDYDDEDEDEEGEDMDMEFDDEYDNGVDLAELLTATLATEEGDTVCTALVTIGEQLATQNKILLKMLSTLSKKDN